MIQMLLGVAILLIFVSVALLRWWFIGPDKAGAEADPALIAAGFAEAKYKALQRLMDASELTELERRREMPSALATRLAAGRRQLLSAYLEELALDFSRVHRLYARLQALHPLPAPKAARMLLGSWIRFEWLHAQASWQVSRGRMPLDQAARMVDETRRLFALFAGGDEGPAAAA